MLFRFYFSHFHKTVYVFTALWYLKDYSLRFFQISTKDPKVQNIENVVVIKSQLNLL